jgi:hypothetical protein
MPDGPEVCLGARGGPRSPVHPSCWRCWCGLCQPHAAMSVWQARVLKVARVWGAIHRMLPQRQQEETQVVMEERAGRGGMAVRPLGVPPEVHPT